MNMQDKWKQPLLSAILVLSLAACSSVDLGQGTGDASGNGNASSTQGSGGDQANSKGTNADGVKGVELGNNAEQSKAAENLGKVIYFDYDSFALKDEYAPLIAGHARALSEDRTLRVILAGHTDERGSREYNLALGQQRAEAVKRALSLLGAQDLQVEAISYGEEKPASLGGDEASFAKNRRVELRYR